jgi:hypothetical protein
MSSPRIDPLSLTASHIHDRTPLGTKRFDVKRQLSGIGCTRCRLRRWKLPLPVSGGFRAAIAPIGEYAAFEVHRWIAKNIFISVLPVLGPLVYLTELSLAVTFILGFLVRPMGVVGMLFVTHLWLGLYRQPEEWPWLYVFLIFVQGFFVVTNAGKSLGLDAVIARKSFGPFAGNGVLARVYR